MTKEKYIEAFGKGEFEYEPDIFKEFDKYKNKKIEFRIGAEKYTLYTPLALLAAVDPWVTVFIQNTEFRKIMSEPDVLKHLSKFIEKYFIDNTDSSDLMHLEKLEEYLPIRHAIWSYYNKVFFEQTKEKLKKAKKILEIGCGTGTLCKLIADEFPDTKIVGIDKNERPLKYAKQHSKEKNIDYHTGSLSKLTKMLDEKYGKFDVCLGLTIIPVLRFDDVLKHVNEGGHYIMTLPPVISQIKSDYKLNVTVEPLKIKIHPWVQKPDYVINIKKLAQH